MSIGASVFATLSTLSNRPCIVRLWALISTSLYSSSYVVCRRAIRDLSNITFVQGDTGWIVFDPLISAETAKAAYDLVTEHLGKKPALAVICSHLHVDHYGGVRGVVDEADVKAGKVKIIAPEHFMEHAISENVTAGNAMSRRAIYLYGAMLPRNEKGGVNGGLGMTTSTGTAGVIIPTDIVTKTGQEITVDGVKMIFQMTPGAEAPAEMNTYFPLCKECLYVPSELVNASDRQALRHSWTQSIANLPDCGSPSTLKWFRERGHVEIIPPDLDFAVFHFKNTATR